MSIPKELKGETLVKAQCQYCAICGRKISRKESGDQKLTSDHVIPKSKGGTGGTMQYTCQRCNALKSDLPSTAECYRLVRAVRNIEAQYPELRCNSIHIIKRAGIEVTYYVSFKQDKIWFTWDTPSGKIIFGCRGTEEGVWAEIGRRAIKQIIISQLA